MSNIRPEVDHTLDSEEYSRKSSQNQSVCKKKKHKLNTFTESGHLSDHKLIHSGIKKYQCDVCSKSFTQSGHLSRHKLIHTVIKKYQCDVCSKSFTDSNTLSNHKLIHSGIKNYQCDVCSKSFTYASNLSEHKLIPVSYTHLDVYKRQNNE